MTKIKVIKGSQLPVVEDINKSTFLAYEDKTVSLKSGRIDLKAMTPLFGVSQDKGQSLMQAPSQNAWTNETIAKDKTILNITQLSNRIFATRDAAREAVPAHLRGAGQILVYKLSLGEGEQSTNFTKTEGQSVKYNTGVISQTSEDRENMCITIPLIEGLTAVSLRIVITGSDNGGAFYDANNNYISGFRFMAGDGVTGEFKTVSIPTGARVCKTTYKVDGSIGAALKWDYVTLYSGSSDSVSDVVEYYKAVTVSSWRRDSNWEDVKDPDKNTYLVGTRGSGTYTDKTEEVKARLTLHRSINKVTGAITEDLTRDISIIYMQPIQVGQYLRMLIDFPDEFERNSQPVIFVYKKEVNGTHILIDWINWRDDNSYKIVNNYGFDIYLSFYTQVTNSVTFTNFDIFDTIRANSYNKVENSIKRRNGGAILSNIDRLVYVESDLNLVDVTNTLLSKMKPNYGISNLGVLGTNPINHKIIQMAELSPNTTYKISGLKNTWGNSFPYLFIYGKTATNDVPSVAATKILTHSDLDKNGDLIFTTDSVNTKISMYVAYNGTTYPVFDSESTIKLYRYEQLNFVLKDEAGNVIQSAGGSSSGPDLSKVTEIRVPFPTSIAKLNIKVDNLPAFKGDKKNCTVEVDFRNGNSFERDSEIDIQGATTASNPLYLQKNYTLGFLNKDGSECNIKIGDFPFDTKCQIKSFWTDSSHARDTVLSSIINDYDMMKPYGLQLPYSKYYKGYETGAKCISLGLPFEVSINGVWHGLYQWILRFKKGNWNIDKNNPNHILMKSGSSEKPMTAESIQVNDEYWEFENPKLNDTTRAKVMRLFDFLRTQNAATYKAELHNYMDIESVLEYFIWIDAFQLIDNFWGNLVLVSYDGNIFYARVRDLDRSLGISFNDKTFLNPTTPLNQEEKYAKSIWFPKLWSAFQDELKVKYADMHNKVLNIEYFAKKFQEHENVIGAELFDKSLKRWPTRPSNIVGYETNANQIITHYKQRLVYLDTKYGYGTV